MGWFSNRIALAASRAQRLEARPGAWLQRIVEELAHRADVLIGTLRAIIVAPIAAILLQLGISRQGAGGAVPGPPAGRRAYGGCEPSTKVPDHTLQSRPMGTRAPRPVHTTGETESLRLSDQLERWLTGEGEKTLGSLVHTFGDKSFAILLVLLLAVPALPLPTGGVTHVCELIAALIALELIGGRHEVWLPDRWRSLELAGPRQQRFIAGLMRLIRRLERYSRPRLRFLFHRRFSEILFGVLAIAGTAGAFLAPPFSGLDTLPALGVVVLSLGVLFEDALITLAGMLLAATGIALELVLGAAAFHGLSSIL